MIQKYISCFIGICVMLTMSACRSNENDNSSLVTPLDTTSSIYQPDTDYQYFFHWQGVGQRIAASPDGYYVLNGSYLYYMDKQHMEPILLDNNPNNDCAPDSSTDKPRNCLAYVQTEAGFGSTTITYYKNYLYLVERMERTDKDALGEKRYALVRMDKDGTNRRVLRQFNAPPLSVVIHRDNIYYVNNLMMVDQVLQPSVLSVPLATPDKEPTIVLSLEPRHHFNDLVAYGDKLYLMDSADHLFRTIAYDLNTQKTNMLFTDDTGSLSIPGIPEIKLSHGSKGGIALYGIHGSRLYTNIYPGDPQDPAAWRIYSSDLDGQNVSIVPVNLPLTSWAYADQNYFYLNPVSWLIKSPDYAEVAQEMVVYDRSYKEVNRVDISMLTTFSPGFIGDEQYLFFQSSDAVERTYILDKSKLQVSGEASLQLLMETAVYKTN